MDEKEFKKYVELIMSMCVDFLAEGIDRKTFETNLKLLSERIQDSGCPRPITFVTNDNAVDEHVSPPKFDIE